MSAGLTVVVVVCPPLPDVPVLRGVVGGGVPLRRAASIAARCAAA
ncbi:unannotated protein [freshwater metagenome]|uniref:Unannotated protein n=1 Tax=freshwater metagenome TaxID=449393 RepID=A0A6J7NFX2_9ZZZZ